MTTSSPLDVDLANLLSFPNSNSTTSPDPTESRPTTSSSSVPTESDWNTLFGNLMTPPSALPLAGTGTVPTPLALATGGSLATVGKPDDIFAANWSTPLNIGLNMQSSDSHSPTDFAFELPADKTPGSGYTFTPSTGGYSLPYNGYSTGGSSFSSTTSGSMSGTSFSSDALPAISRDFSRPHATTARRPATAGGVLQSRSPFGGYLQQDNSDPGLFSNPFDSADPKLSQPETVDPRFIPANRRASESQAMPPPSWPQPGSAEQGSADLTSPAVNTSFNNVYQGPSARSFPVNRPQTSDGLPSFGGQTNLPSARAMVGSVDGFNSLSETGLAPAAHIRSSYDDAFRGERPDPRIAYMPSKVESGLTFVPLGGPTPRKRPRRRYDEIERLYLCGWNGCEKSYGTLNHLNAHVAMQKHGEKRLPQEFKDMRKAWRKKKREQAAAAQYNMNNGGGPSDWTRSSMSSSSDYDRRESAASMMSTGGMDGRYAGTSYSYDSRPTTASSIASSTDSRPFSSYSQASFGGYPQPIQAQAQAQQMMMHPHGHPHAHVHGYQSHPPTSAGSGASRRGSAPQHIAIPTQAMGFRQADDGTTPTPQNPFPFGGSGSGSGSGGMQAMPAMSTGMSHDGRPMSAHAAMPMSMSGQQAQAQGSGQFPFQALTQPMPMMGGPTYGQFAFQR